MLLRHIDNLLLAKITQVHHTSRSQGPDPQFCINDLVMLATTNRRHKYKKKAKVYCQIFPRWDGPYRGTGAHQRSLHIHSTSQRTNPDLPCLWTQMAPCQWCGAFPITRTAQPGPILTLDGMEEYLCGTNNQIHVDEAAVGNFLSGAWIWTPTRPMDCLIWTIWLWSSWQMVSEQWWWARLKVAFLLGFAIIFSLEVWCTRDCHVVAGFYFT